MIQEVVAGLQFSAVTGLSDLLHRRFQTSVGDHSQPRIGMREGAQVGCGCVVADPEVTRLETTSGLPVNRPRLGKASGPGASSGPSPAVGHGIPFAMPTFQY